MAMVTVSPPTRACGVLLSKVQVKAGFPGEQTAGQRRPPMSCEWRVLLKAYLILRVPVPMYTQRKH
jgi:hypothetical protein